MVEYGLWFPKQILLSVQSIFQTTMSTTASSSVFVFISCFRSNHAAAAAAALVQSKLDLGQILFAYTFNGLICLIRWVESATTGKKICLPNHSLASRVNQLSWWCKSHLPGAKKTQNRSEIHFLYAVMSTFNSNVNSLLATDVAVLGSDVKYVSCLKWARVQRDYVLHVQTKPKAVYMSSG